ncbi:unnamed protein product, partial [Mesorhabditis belari]|uniref:Uncharacterized protein n=1 Tax=Mesorhabditis belari TaxID=2138241 RepID=A0AAF3J7H1_9BILA
MGLLDFVILLLQVCGVGLNVLFLVTVIGRLTSRCFFIQHSVSVTISNILVVLYSVLLVSNPFYKMDQSDAAKQGSETTFLWGTGVFVHLFQHFGIVILAISRTVALTFKTHVQHQVWSNRVCLTALCIQLLFPVAFVAVFATDGPEITYGKTMVWNNRILYAGYRFVLFVIYVVTSGLALIGITAGLIKRKAMLRQKRLSNGLSIIPTNDRNVVIHTVRTSEELNSQPIQYMPNTIPTLKAEAGFSVIVGLLVLTNLIQFFFLQLDFPSGENYGEMAFVAMATYLYPVGIVALIASPIIKYKLRNDRGLICRLYRRLAGPTMRDVAVLPPPIPTKMEPNAGVSAIYQPRRNTIMNMS